MTSLYLKIIARGREALLLDEMCEIKEQYRRLTERIELFTEEEEDESGMTEEELATAQSKLEMEMKAGIRELNTLRKKEA